MKAIKQGDYPIKWIPLANLSVVWLDAQRPRNEREEKRIAEHFDPDAFDPITVTLPNGHGVYHIIDGQTRHGAMVRFSNGDLGQKVPCRVLDTRTKQDAARIWSTMNSGHKKPTALESFLVDVTAKSEEAVAINDIVNKLGLRVTTGADNGAVAAVGALRTVYRSGGDVALTWVLGTLRETWGRDRDAYCGALVQGYAQLLKKHGNTIDRKRLVATVQKKHTPGQLIGNARTSRTVLGGTLPANVVTVLETAYNTGIRTGARLES